VENIVATARATMERQHLDFDRSDPGTGDEQELKGAPDLTIKLLKDPKVYLMVGE
jgi:hypothetical protein